MTHTNKNFKQKIPLQKIQLQNYICMGVITNTKTGETQKVHIPAERIFKSVQVVCTPS